jgi:hypothetical protein
LQNLGLSFDNACRLGIFYYLIFTRRVIAGAKTVRIMAWLDLAMNGRIMALSWPCHGRVMGGSWSGHGLVKALIFDPF